MEPISAIALSLALGAGATAGKAVVNELVKDGELVDAANRLIELVRTQAPNAAAAIGVDLKDVEAANLRLRDVVASGTGVKLEKGRLSGDIEISNLRAGVKRDDPATRG
jgi:hypothetical protein